MTHPAITQMLGRYDLSNASSGFYALREILQEVVLVALYDAGFFRQAAFYGGTALRVLHRLPRFSEDLDFSLLEPQPDFDITPFRQAIIDTLQAYGFTVSVEIKQKSSASAVASAFIKGNTLEHLLAIEAPAEMTHGVHKGQAVKIKLEVDTDPPPNFQTEEVISLVPRSHSIKTFTMPCLFAGKMHAVLCRAWGNRPKGRDWYDLVWYVSRRTPLDLVHLQARLAQSCTFLENQKIALPAQLTGDAVLGLLEQRIASLDIDKAKADVLPFIRDVRELQVWSPEFFMEIIRRIKFQG